MTFVTNKNIVIIKDNYGHIVLYNLIFNSAFEINLKVLQFIVFLMIPKKIKEINRFLYKQGLDSNFLEELINNKIVMKLRDEKRGMISNNIFDTTRIIQYAKKKKKLATSKIGIYITNQCNLNCIHCGLLSGKKMLCELSDKDWLKIVDQAYKNKFKILQFTGGEPFLRKKLIERIVKNYGHKFEYVSINTNATLIDEKIAKFLGQYKNLIVYVSIYGYDQQSFLKMTTRDLFEVADRGIRIMAKYKIHLRASISLTNTIIEEIEKYNRYIQRYSIDEIAYIGILPHGRALINYKKLVGPWYKYLNKLTNYLQISQELLFSEKTITDLPWHLANKRLIIYANGEVYPSEFFPILLGNVKYESIKSIINKRLSKYILDEFNVDEIRFCRECIYRYICKAICPSFAYTATGDFRNPPPTCKLAINNFYKKFLKQSFFTK